MRCPRYFSCVKETGLMSEQLAKVVALHKKYARNMDLNCVLATKNRILSVFVVAPPDAASIIVLREGETTVAP